MFNHGDVFGSYQIVREIGRGGMGAVYEAEHLQLRKRVALKVLLPERAEDIVTVQRFVREGQAASRIRHDHIVDVIDVGMHDGVAYLVMELLEGESLADRLHRDIRLGAEALADLALPLVDALAAAHEAGVVHRDIKPENIFLARVRRGRCEPKLVDFGISRIERAEDPNVARLTSSTVLVGTPCYMAPEAARGARNVNALSDQYALGVVLYEAITGQLPFERASLFEVISAILTERPTDPAALVPSLDPRMDAVILRAMAREPEARFPDMRSLGAALLPIASEPVRALWAAEFVGAATGPTSRPDPIAPPAFALAATDRPPGAVTLDEAPPPERALPELVAPPPRSHTSLVRATRSVSVGGALAAVGMLALGALLAASLRARPLAPAPPTAAPPPRSAPVAPSLPVASSPAPAVAAPAVAAPAVAAPAVAAPLAPRRPPVREARLGRLRSAPIVAPRLDPSQPASPDARAPRTGAQSLLRADFEPTPR